MLDDLHCAKTQRLMFNFHTPIEDAGTWQISKWVPVVSREHALNGGKNSATLPNLHIAGRQEKYTYFYINTVAEKVAAVCVDLVSPYSLAIQGTDGREEWSMSAHWPSGVHVK